MPSRSQSATPPRPTRRGRAPAAPDPAGTAGQVQSLTRGLSLLEALAAAEGGLTLTDLAQRAGLPASTTHRLLNTLERLGYVTQGGDPGPWYVGLEAFTVGSAFLANRDFVGQSHPFLRRLMEQSGETANLAILDDAEAVFIAQVQCREMMRMLVKLGSRAPLHASGVGKAILAALPDEQIEAFLSGGPLPRHTEHTIVTQEALRASIGEIRRRGYSFDDEEHVVGMRCVAAAVYDEHAEPLGALSLAGPVSRLSDARIGELGPLVARTASRVTAQLGGRWPHPY